MTRGQFLEASLGLTFLPSLKIEGSSLGRLMKPPNDSFRMTEQIKTAYEVGLKILKPTRSQLQHGLELHRNSIVIEAYGFMPRAAVDGAVLAKAMNDDASSLELQDLREEMIMTRMVANQREREEFENAWKASGVTCIGQNAGEEGDAIERLLKRLARFTYSTDMMSDFVCKAVTPDDIVWAKQENRHALYFTGNGVPLPQHWVSVEEELGFIRIFFQLGIRMMHLTYNRRNVIGDGCGEIANGGLSDFGRYVVKEMNKIGVMIDISHSGWQTSLEAAQVSEKPVVASHSVAASINNVIRSKPDNVIKAIADSGGYMGITCIPRFLGGSGDIAATMKHVDYVVKKFGCDFVNIATDHAHSSQYNAEENKIMNSLVTRGRAPQRPRWASLWADESFNSTLEMSQSNAWTNWPLFTVGMVQMGYSDSNIQKILGGNALRVARAALA